MTDNLSTTQFASLPAAQATARLSGGWYSPDGAAPIGPDQYPPQPGKMTRQEFLSALNPLQHLPGVGMVYRAITGEKQPPSMQILDSAASGLLFGGPFGVLGTMALCFAEGFLKLGPNPVDPSMITYNNGGEAGAGGKGPVSPPGPLLFGSDGVLAQWFGGGAEAAKVTVGPDPQATGPTVAPAQAGQAVAAYVRAMAIAPYSEAASA